MRLIIPWLLVAATSVSTVALTWTAAAQTQMMVVGYFGELPPGQSWNRLKDGRVYQPNSDLIAAHRTLPIGTRLRVTTLETPTRSVEVTVLDRGPFIPGRDLDISTAAARALGIIEDGIARLQVQVLSRP